ncbi:MAG TPA: cyclophilin-like fold protein [Chloroflexota bacterium]|nr:cyclophilin-like fold protein [Chloroflexota bacterium]
MSRLIRITAGAVQAEAELTASATASAIWEALPLSARASTWGDEIYFSIPVHLDEEQAQETVARGDLGYWPPGNAFCIFFGPTPASRSAEEIRPASPVNVFGRLRGDAAAFKRVRSGETVRVERVEAG